MDKVILLVDDDASVRHMFTRMLNVQGYQTVEADSAEEGWAQFGQVQPDLVITDLAMPGKDGLWLAQQIHSFDPDVPVLLITAYADLGSAQRAISLGIYEFYTKPVDLHQVLGGVQRGLEFRRLAQENRSYQEELERKVEGRTKDLERAYQELVQTEKLSEVGRLAAGVVHEVLNPLTVVMGRLEMVMMDQTLGEKFKQSLQLSRDQLKRAVKIMDNLRDFSRQRSSQPEKIDVNGLLAQTIDLMTYETRHAHVSVNPNLGSLPEICADKDQLAQVFLNMIKNAVEAMANGGTLTITTAYLAERNLVVIVFADTGIGIAKAYLEQVFELFFTTKKTGTGLGLSICRGIVELHGGTLLLESEEKKGATFTIELPVS